MAHGFPYRGSNSTCSKTIHTEAIYFAVRRSQLTTVLVVSAISLTWPTSKQAGRRVIGSRFEYVAQGLHNLFGGRAPGLGPSIDLFEWMDDIVPVQRHVRLA